MYLERFWKKNWDEGIDDLKPEEFETTYVEMINRTFKEVLMVLDLRNKFLDRFSVKSYFKS